MRTQSGLLQRASSFPRELWEFPRAHAWSSLGNPGYASPHNWPTCLRTILHQLGVLRTHILGWWWGGRIPSQWKGRCNLPPSGGKLRLQHLPIIGHRNIAIDSPNNAINLSFFTGGCDNPVLDTHIFSNSILLRWLINSLMQLIGRKFNLLTELIRYTQER